MEPVIVGDVKNCLLLSFNSCCLFGRCFVSVWIFFRSSQNIDIKKKDEDFYWNRRFTVPETRQLLHEDPSKETCGSVTTTSTRDPLYQCDVKDGKPRGEKGDLGPEGVLWVTRNEERTIYSSCLRFGPETLRLLGVPLPLPPPSFVV